MRFFFLFVCLLFLSSCVSSQVQQKKIQQSESYHQIAVKLIKSCDNPRALAHLLRAIKLSPKNFLIRHTLANVYYLMKEYEKAIGEFKKILKQNPDFTEAYVSLSIIYTDLNQYDEALRQITIAEKDITYKDPLKILSQKGAVYYKKGDFISAKRWLEEAFSLPRGKKDCFVHLNLGRTETALGNFKRSEQLLKTAVSICQKEKPPCAEGDYEEYRALADMYIKKGDKNRARYHLNLFLDKKKRGHGVKEAQRILKQLSE